MENLAALNRLIYDIDPYDYIDCYDSLEEGEAALSDVYYDVAAMEDILSWIHSNMADCPEQFGQEEKKIVSDLERHINMIKH